MGLFDGFGHRDACPICGGNLGFMGNTHLADGVICKGCAEQVSPFVDLNKNFTVQDVSDHLQYRAYNFQNLESFLESRRVVLPRMVMAADDTNGDFLIARNSNYLQENPDLIPFSEVTGGQIRILENMVVQHHEVPGQPPMEIHRYSYRVLVYLYVNNDWFKDITFNITPGSIDAPEIGQLREAYHYMEEVVQFFAYAGIQLSIQDGSSFGLGNLIDEKAPLYVLRPDEYAYGGPRSKGIAYGVGMGMAQRPPRQPQPRTPHETWPQPRTPEPHTEPIAPRNTQPRTPQPMHNEPMHNEPRMTQNGPMEQTRSRQSRPMMEEPGMEQGRGRSNSMPSTGRPGAYPQGSARQSAPRQSESRPSSTRQMGQGMDMEMGMEQGRGRSNSMPSSSRTGSTGSTRSTNSRSGAPSSGSGRGSASNSRRGGAPDGPGTPGRR